MPPSRNGAKTIECKVLRAGIIPTQNLPIPVPAAPQSERESQVMQNKFMELVERTSMKEKIPHFEIGDTVDVHVRILEGEKERIQIFNGVVIARSGSHTREMVVVRRIVQGEGVERKFPVHSPRVADIVVKRSGKVRRAKLYYLRDRTGKAVRLKERFHGGTATAAEAKAAKAEKRATRLANKEAKLKTKADNKAAAAAAKEKPAE